MKRLVAVLLIAALWPVAARAGGLAVAQYVWGFDGRAVPGRVNLLSVEVSNATSRPVEQRLRLHRSFHLGGRLGAPLEQPCYLSPGATRWVQFYPYVQSADDAWSLEWGMGLGARVALKEPKLGPPTRVLLQDPENPLTRSRLATFPDNLWPPTVAATDGLHSAVLDHVPRWEPARRGAFLDWLRRGGQLHVLHGVNGRYPAFRDELAVLNAPLDRFRVGAGLVVRHPRQRRDVTNDVLRSQGFPLPSLKENREGSIHSPDGDLLQALTGASRPRHSWALIYLTALAYIGVLGIYHYFYARGQRDWRRTLGVFFATVAVCSLLLGFIGKRGQGEAAAVHSIAYARHLGGDSYDVTQWHNVFVTRGAVYAVTHDAPHNVYSTCQSEEAVKGVIRNGRGGAFAVDIPLFSSRAFLHRGRLQGHHISLEIREWKADVKLRKLVLEPEEGFPTDAPEMVALYRGSFYPVVYRDGALRATPTLTVAALFLRLTEVRLGKPWKKAPDRWDDPRQFRDTTGFGAFVRPVIAHATGGTKDFYQQLVFPTAGNDHIQLFIVARSPEGLGASGKRLGKRKGFVVYHVHLFKPETPDG